MIRNVGQESSKTYECKLLNGFFTKFMSGHGLDIGGTGYNNAEPILDTATIIDLNYPNYDGINLPILTESQDYVYSSHCLEHIINRKDTIKDWYRVTKVGGFIIIIVPHQDLYEKKDSLPSRFNGDHKVFYRASNLLKEIEDSLKVNSYRIRHLIENDIGHDYNQSEEEHSKWLYEIEVVLEKIR